MHRQRPCRHGTEWYAGIHVCVAAARGLHLAIGGAACAAARGLAIDRAREHGDARATHGVWLEERGGGGGVTEPEIQAYNYRIPIKYAI